MKTYNYFLLLICAFLLGYSNLSASKPEKGSGKIISEERTITTFNSIVLSGKANVILTQGSNESVKIETDDNLMQFVNTEVSNKTLYIKMNKSTSPKKLNIYITVKMLQEYILKGSCELTANSSLKFDKFKIELHGSANILLKSLECSNLDVVIKGTGKLELNGKAFSANYDINGTGNINAPTFETTNSDVSIRGVGNCKVWAIENLKATINGTGSISYKGKPKNIDKSIRGVGSIEPIK